VFGKIVRAEARTLHNDPLPIRENNGEMDPNAIAKPPELAPEDYYYEGPYLVFTAAYHLKRGYCCGSGCRHCPYRVNANAGEKQNADPPASPSVETDGSAQDDMA
jgi:hypothetical protein